MFADLAAQPGAVAKKVGDADGALGIGVEKARSGL